MLINGIYKKSNGGGSGGNVDWGDIGGTLSDQTDLANALAEKQDTLTAGTGIDITNDVISATISGLTNTATGSGSLTILGTATGAANATNIGATSSVTGNYSTALGYGAGVVSNATRAIQIGEGTNDTSNTFSVGFGTNNYRLLDGSTGKIPNDRLSSFTGATSSVAGSVGAVPAPTTSDVGKFLSADGTWATVSGGSGIQNTATGTESLTVLGTATSALYSINIGSRSSVTNYNSVVMGNSASASGTDATAIGCLATASDNYATAIGKSAQATGNASIALGPSAVASGVQCYQIGNGTNSTYKTLSVGFGPLHGNYILLDGTTGKIPNDRIDGATGSFTSQDGKTVTVTNGVITSIV